MTIEELIKQSAKNAFSLLAEKELENRRLVYPKKHDKELRCSEQELKMLFIENVCDLSDFHYSVETPTKFGYKFSGEPDIFEEKNKTQYPARIDLTLHEKDSHYNLEFKNGQADKKSIKKDILKLTYEQSEGNYFVHIIHLKDDSVHDRTKNRLTGKFNDAYIESLKLKKGVLCPDSVTVYIIFITAKNYEIIRKTFTEKNNCEWETVKL